jgi:tetratricopeptide (TPR) repeat protein
VNAAVRNAAGSLVLLAACGVSRAQEEPPAQGVETKNRLRERAFTAELAGRHGEAADAFLDLVSLEPGDPSWALRAADNLGKVGRFNDAMDLLERARTKFKDVPDLSLALARTYHLKADTMRSEGITDVNVMLYYQDTVRVASQLLEVDRQNVEARLLLASARFQLGELDDALTVAQSVVADQPKVYGGNAMVGRIAFHLYVTAQQRLNTEQPSGREKAELVEQVNAHRKLATDAFEAAAAADPNRAFPQVKLGDLAAWTGRMEVALRHYGAALAIEPGVTLDHGWLRSAVDAEKRTALYRTAAEAYGARPDATAAGKATLRWYEAQAIYDQKEWAKAAELFESTLAGLPDYADTYYYLVLGRYWGGDTAAATRHAVAFATKNARRFADMIRGDEQTVAIVKGMAAERYRAGELVASRELNHVLAFAHQRADEWNNYAFLCRETRAFAESWVAYQEALAIEPESPQLLNDAAVILQYHLPTKENLATARNLYERAIAASEQQLADSSLDETARERARTACADAKSNLQKLGPAK